MRRIRSGWLFQYFIRQRSEQNLLLCRVCCLTYFLHWGQNKTPPTGRSAGDDEITLFCLVFMSFLHGGPGEQKPHSPGPDVLRGDLQDLYSIRLDELSIQKLIGQIADLSSFKEFLLQNTDCQRLPLHDPVE